MTLGYTLLALGLVLLGLAVGFEWGWRAAARKYMDMFKDVLKPLEDDLKRMKERHER